MKNLILLLVCVSCVASVCVGTDILLAQGWPTDPAQNLPICTEMDDQKHPMITEDGAGGAVMAWFDIRSGDHHAIYAQRVDVYGEILWTAVGVLVCDKPALTICEERALWTFALRMIPAGDGGAIFAWSDKRALGDYNVYAQRLSPAGEPMWVTDGILICGLPGMQAVAGISGDGNGGAIIVWDDMRGGDGDLYAQRIDKDGNVQWKTNGVPIGTGLGFQYFGSPVPDGKGGAIIAWLDTPGYMADPDLNSIMASRINASGVIVWTQTICSPPHAAVPFYARLPVAGDGAGGAIVAWQDYRGGTETMWDIYVQRIDADGHTRWNPNGVAVCVMPEDQPAGPIVGDGSGGAVMAWHDDRVRGNRDIYAQRVTSDGTVAWAANGIPICTELRNQEYCFGIAKTSDGRFMIAWAEPQRLSVGGGSLDIYAQRVNLQGTISWKMNGVQVSTAPGHQEGYDMIADSKAGAMVIWKDRRSFNFTREDIYAQRIRHDGSLGPPYMNGDVTGDSLINVLDVISAVNLILDDHCAMMLDPECQTADCNGPPGNCDGDGLLNVLDVLKMVNLILRLDACP